MLAITSINQHANENELAVEEKVILACEFISDMDKDTDFHRWLENRNGGNFNSQKKKK